MKETTQVEAIVEMVSNITRGSVGGGEGQLVPNPVVDIIEVSQGSTIFQEGVDWQQSGRVALASVKDACVIKSVSTDATGHGDSEKTWLPTWDKTGEK